MKIVKLKFKKSVSLDTAGYRLYFTEYPTEIIKGQTPVVDITNFLTPDVSDDNYVSVILNDIPIFGDLEGVYNFGLEAYDRYDNDSPILINGLENITIDFLAPAPPTNAVIIYE